MKVFTVKLILVITVIASAGFFVFHYIFYTPNNSETKSIPFEYNTPEHSEISIKPSCSNYHTSDFITITDEQISKSKLLWDISEGFVVERWYAPAYDTKTMLNALGKVPKEHDRIGLIHEGTSYIVNYNFTKEPDSGYRLDFWGCYMDGLHSHFDDIDEVQKFKAKYGNNLDVHSDNNNITFSKKVPESYSAKLTLYFDEDFRHTDTDMRCMLYEKDVEYNIEKEDIMKHLVDMHCLYDKYPYAKISINELQSSFAVGEKVNDFTIKLEGYYPKPHAPDIKLVNETNHVLWTNYDDIGHVTLGRISPVDFCKEYKFYHIGDPVMLNNTGEYKFIFSFEKFSFEHIFFVRENLSGNVVDKSGFGCS